MALESLGIEVDGDSRRSAAALRAHVSTGVSGAHISAARLVLPY